MTWGLVAVAAVEVAGAVGSSMAQSSAIKKAENAQAAAADAAISNEQQGLATEEAQLQPYMTAGNTALQTLIAGLTPGGQFNQNFNYTATPQYAGAVAAGQDAITARAAATGQSLSPATLGALGQFTANAALQDYSTAYTQWLQKNGQVMGGLQNLESAGQNATDASVNAINAETGSVSNLITGKGNAVASADLAQGAATAGMINGVTSAVAGGISGYTSKAAGQQYVNSLYTPASNQTAISQDQAFVNDPLTTNMAPAGSESQVPGANYTIDPLASPQASQAYTQSVLFGTNQN